MPVNDLSSASFAKIRRLVEMPFSSEGALLANTPKLSPLVLNKMVTSLFDLTCKSKDRDVYNDALKILGGVASKMSAKNFDNLIPPLLEMGIQLARQKPIYSSLGIIDATASKSTPRLAPRQRYQTLEALTCLMTHAKDSTKAPHLEPLAELITMAQDEWHLDKGLKNSRGLLDDPTLLILTKNMQRAAMTTLALGAKKWPDAITPTIAHKIQNHCPLRKDGCLERMKADFLLDYLSTYVAHTHETKERPQSTCARIIGKQALKF